MLIYEILPKIEAAVKKAARENDSNLKRFFNELSFCITEDRKRSLIPALPDSSPASEKTMLVLKKIHDYCGKKYDIAVLC
jgi:hypothetical protein